MGRIKIRKKEEKGYMAKQLNKSIAGGNSINFNVGFKTNKTSLDSIKNSLTEIQKMTQSDLMDINKGMNLETADAQLREIRQTATTVQQALSNSFNKELGTTNVSKFNAELSKSGLSLNQISATFSKAGIKGQTAFRNITTELLTTEIQIKKTHSLIQDMANTMANTVKWGVASSIMNNFTGSVQKAYGFVKQLDTSLNNIMIVSGKSSKEMGQFAKEANKAAKELSAQTTTYTDAALIYYQQGLGDEESKARADATVKVANVTGMSGDAASESLTAVWNGYKVNTEDTTKVVDKLAKVANGTAADLEELSTGMSKVASAANTAGVDIDQLNATLATVISVTREAPETIGTAFKTIYARMGDLALDGEDEYGVKLGSVSGKLHELGIELLDEKGQMRDMGTVIEETAAKWDSWTAAQKQAAAVAMAGKMQYSRLMSLFENWDMYENALDMSKNSLGELDRDQKIYEESTAAHLKKVEAAWEGVYNSLFTGKDFNDVLDLLVPVIDQVEDLIKLVGGGKGVLLALGSTALSVFKDQIGSGLATTIMNMQAVNSNAKQMQAQFEMIGKLKSIGITDDATKEIIEMKEELLKYSHLLTEDQQNQATAFINARNEIEKEKSAILEAQEAASNFFGSRTSMNTEDAGTFSRKENGEGSIDFLNSMGGLGSSGDSDVYISKLDEIDKKTVSYEKTLESLTKTYEEYRKAQASSDSGSGSTEEVGLAYDKYKEAVKDLREEMAHLADSEIVLENETGNLVESYMAFDKTTEEIGEGGNLDDVADEIKNMRKVFSSTIKTIKKDTSSTRTTIEKNLKDPFKDVEDKVKSFKKEWKGFKKELTLGNAISGITGVISGFGQFASVIGTVRNTFEGLKNGTTDFIDILTTAPIVIGQVASGMNSFGNAFKSLTGAPGILQTIKGNIMQINLARQSGFSIIEAGAIKEKAMYDAEEAAEIAKAARQKANLAAKEAEALAMANATAAAQGKAVSDAELAAAETASATASELDAEAKAAETAATEAATVAQWANNAALYANPIVLIVAGIIAAVAALALLTAALWKSNREQEKANELEAAKNDLSEKSKVADKAREESEAIRDLADNYRDLYKQYQQNAISSEDLKNKAYDLVKAYGDEKLAVLALTGEYEKLNTEIDKRQKEKNQTTENASKQEQSSIQKTMAADIRKNRKESEIDKDDAGVKGWSIDLKGTNGINSKAENKLIGQLKDLGIDTGNGSGHISLDDFIKVATEKESDLREILENSETDAAKQLLSILEDEKDYLDKYKNSVSEMQKAQQENIGLKYKEQVNDVASYEEAVQKMVDEATSKGIYKKNKDGQKAARAWAESYLAGVSDEINDFAKRSTLSESITDTLEKQISDGFKDSINSELGKNSITKDLANTKSGKKVVQNSADKMAEEQTKQLSAALKELSSEELAAIASTANYSDQLLLLWKSTGSAEEAVKSMASAVSKNNNGMHELGSEAKKTAEKLEVSETGLKSFIKYVQKSNDKLKDNYDLAEGVAIRQMKLADALKNCVEKWDDWQDSLEECDKGTIEYYDTLGEMAEAFSDVFGTELSTDFIEKNMSDLKALINGDVDAFQRLQEAAAKDYVANLTIYSNDQEEIDRIKNELNSFIDEYGNKELGFTLKADDSQLVQTLNKALQEGKITEEQMNNYLGGIGYKGKVTYKEVDGPKTKHDVSINLLGKDVKLGTVTSTSKVKVPQIEAVSKNTDSVSSSGSAGSFTANTIKSATQGSNSLSGGKGGNSDPNKKDMNEDEVDRYERVNTQLDILSARLDKIQKQEDKLFGKKLLDNLNKQLQVINQQIDRTNEKLRIAGQEKNELQGKLSGFGVAFDSEGVMTNYAQVFAQQQAALNAIYNHYNSLSADAQKGYEATVEAAEKRWEKFKDAVTDYDTLIGQTIPGLEQDIQDSIDEQIEIKIKEFDMEIDLALDIKEAEDKWNEFKKRIIDDIKDDDILGNAAAELVRGFSFYNDENLGVIQEEVVYLKNLMAEIDKYNSTGWSDWYGDDENSMMEDLQKYYEQAMDDMEEFQDIVDEIHDALNATLEDVADQMEDQMSYYETISDTLEHDMKLVQLIYGEEAYGRLALYYQQQENNLKAQLDFQSAQVDFWKKQLDTLEEGSEAWETAKENWLDAVGEWQSAVETSIENLQEKFVNAINEIFQNLNDKMTGGAGLDFVNTEWELINKNADQYLDTINAAYGIQQLQNKYLDAIDKTDSLSAQRKLNELMNEQIDALREQDKLSQYDLDRANLKYEIALKRIALEEAQQNKSTMRLKRDSQGNYTYQYVSDEDEVKKLQDDLSNLYNQLYNMDTDRYTDNLGEIYDIWVEFQEKMAEAAQINDPAQRLEKEKLLTAQYGELINGLVAQNETIKQNLYESTFLELEDLYGHQSDVVQDFLENQDEAMEILIDGWSSGLQEMADEIFKEGGFEATYEEALERIKEATEEYEEDLEELQEAANVTFESLGEDIDETQNEVQQLIGDTTELVQTFSNEVSQIQNVITQIDNLKNKYAEQVQAINTVTEAYNKYIDAMKRAETAAANNANSGSGAQSNKASSSSSSAPAPAPSNPYAGYRLGGQQYTIKSGDSLWSIAKAKYGNGNLYTEIWAHNSGNLRSGNPNLIYPGEVIRLDTGGYTGDWNSSDGRMAMLHQKELVLNKQDTENILNTVEIMRNLTNSLGSSILKQISNMTANGFNLESEFGGDVLEQDVHIDATFPNVSNSNEIENALNNLVNAAAQRVNKR